MLAKADLVDTLVEFFLDSFQEDPVGVGDWLAQNGQDIDAFLDQLKKAGV